MQRGIFKQIQNNGSYYIKKQKAKLLEMCNVLFTNTKTFAISEFVTTFHVFAFKTRETGELFINNFAELLKKAESLI